MTETKINVVKQWAINAKSFSVVEVIEELQKENAELQEQNKIILEDNDTLNKWVDELKAQVESMKKTLSEISEYADEKPIHNIAQNELDKWE